MAESEEFKQYQIVLADVGSEGPARVKVFTLSAELLDDPPALKSYLGTVLVRMMGEIEKNNDKIKQGNTQAPFDEVDENGEPMLMHHHNIEDSLKVRVVKKSLD